MIEPVLTFGAVLISGLLGGVALILVAKINNLGSKVDDVGQVAGKAVEQTTATGNGYAGRTTEMLEEVRRSLRQVHRRMDSQNLHTHRRDDHVDGVLMKFDDRLTYIEEKLSEDPTAPHVP